jgi:hypothetical protein
MNDKDFSEVLACFKEAGQIKTGSKKPGRVSKIDPSAGKPVRTKIHPAQDHAKTISAKTSSKKIHTA